MAPIVEAVGPARPAARALISRLDYPQGALSIVEGRAPGRVFVDDPVAPRVALVSEATGNLFIAGEPGQQAASDISRLLQEVLIPEKVGNGRPMCYIDYWPHDWGRCIPAMLPDLQPMADTRYTYSMEVPAADGVVRALKSMAEPPAGCSVRAIDRALLESATIGNLDEVQAEILKGWGTVDAFLAGGHGYCTLQGDDITSWCLTEYPLDGSCGIGVETVEAYRRRGHASAASAAAILKCLRAGIKPYWDLWASNEPSRRLAERLLLTRVATYPVFFLWFNKVDNLLVNANFAATRLGR